MGERSMMNEILEQEFAKLELPFDLAKIRSRCRGAAYTSARRMACKILTAHGYGRSEIGRFIHRDHANVYYLINSIGWKDAPTTSDELDQMKQDNIRMQIKYHQTQINLLKSKLNEPVQRTLQPTITFGIPYGC